MRRLRPFVLAFAAIVAIPIVVQATIQSERAQQLVNIQVNVTAAPLSMLRRTPPAAGAPGGGIVTRLTLDAAAGSPDRAFRAENLALQSSRLVAQNQGGVLVQAEVSPNPNATMLYGNNCGGQYPVTGQCSGVSLPGQVAGTTIVYTCIYSVTVDTTEASWTLYAGLYSDWYNGTLDFPGKDVGYSAYITPSPAPTSTPFVVYSDGQAWATMKTGADEKTFCIDLTVTIPSTTTAGTYSSNAVYTLYY